MNFFARLATLIALVDLQINMTMKDNLITVSILPKAKDKENKSPIAPMVITGTAFELDEGFFETIEKPVMKVAGLIVETSAMEKAAEEAKKEADAKAKAAKDKKDEKAKGKSSSKVEEKDAEDNSEEESDASETEEVTETKPTETKN